MKWKAIFFDLDNTLIRTEQIKQRLFARLAEQGLCSEDIARCYRLAMTSSAGENTFTLAHFSLVVQQETGKTISFDLSSLRAEQILVPGARQALEASSASGIPTVILTLGVRAWQEEKLRMAGLSDLVSDGQVTLTVTTDSKNGKQQAIAPFAQEGDVLIVNDKPDETLALVNEFPTLSAVIRKEPDDLRYINAFNDAKNHARVLFVDETLENIPGLFA
jgi:phosphoglycolate phosphatase-like HAD superfamily hydrolase